MTPALTELASEILAELPDVATVAQAGTTTWSSRGEAFAVDGSSGIEIRLEPAIAAAATRTPDVAPSPRGAEWVRFNPHELDGHAVDRLEAWLGLAYRRAAE